MAEPRELKPWQSKLLDAFARSKLAKESTFGGATALSAVYLHHRRSEDLDFFFMREVVATDLAPLVRALRKQRFEVESRVVGPRRTLILVSKGREIGHVDFAYFPYDPVDRPTRWRGLRVDSLVDISVNKLQAVLTRARERDFVDLYFLLRETPKQDVEKLLVLTRAKFDTAPSRVTLAESLLRVEEVRELPEMIRPLRLQALRRFFVDIARQLVSRGPV